MRVLRVTNGPSIGILLVISAVMRIGNRAVRRSNEHARLLDRMAKEAS